MSRHSTTQSDGANPAHRESDQGEEPRTELRPLLALWPYLARYKLQLALAGVALVVSAVAMLVIPMAVRRVIDLGFGTHDGVFIDKYFAMLIVIGLVLAARQRRALLLRQLAGRACRRRPALATSSATSPISARHSSSARIPAS